MRACVQLERAALDRRRPARARGDPDRAAQGRRRSHTWTIPIRRGVASATSTCSSAPPTTTPRWLRSSTTGVTAGPTRSGPGSTAASARVSASSVPTGVQIDLHRTLASGPFGLTLDADELFDGIEVLSLGGRAVAVLDHRSALPPRVLPRVARRLPTAAHGAPRRRPDGAAPPLDLDRVRALAQRWRAGVVVARPWPGPGRCSASRADPRSSGRSATCRRASSARRWRAYVGPHRSYARQMIAAVPAVPGLGAAGPLRLRRWSSPTGATSPAATAAICAGRRTVVSLRAGMRIPRALRRGNDDDAARAGPGTRESERQRRWRPRAAPDPDAPSRSRAPTRRPPVPASGGPSYVVGAGLVAYGVMVAHRALHRYLRADRRAPPDPAARVRVVPHRRPAREIDDDPRIAQIVIAAFWAHMLGTLVRAAVVAWFYGNRSDALDYHLWGKALRATVPLARLLARGRLTGTDFMRTITGVVYSFTGASKVSGAVVMSFLSFSDSCSCGGRSSARCPTAPSCGTACSCCSCRRCSTGRRRSGRRAGRSSASASRPTASPWP